MRYLGLGLAMVLAGSSAQAAKKKKKPNAEPESAPTPVQVEPEVQPSLTDLFPPVLGGWDPGGLPAGMASLSAQACNACHYQAHDGWSSTAHAGPGSADWRRVSADVGTPACSACHQPLGIQRPERYEFDAGDVNEPVTVANNAFDATLHIEGVTCATCHVRDGRIVGARPVTVPPSAHPQMAWSTELTDADACASCHQLSWPGASQPLYDTYGEWQRSDYAKAGVDCISCHMGPGAEDGAASHRFEADLERALTVEIHADGVAHTRGGPAFEATVTLTNTGAGHAVPTGSPWRELRVDLLLEGPGKDGPSQVGLQQITLGRTLADAPPWHTTEDSRLQVGERREIAFSTTVDGKADPGDWAFVLRVTEEVAGEARATPTLERRLPLRVD